MTGGTKTRDPRPAMTMNALKTDLYQLTMLASYFHQGMHEVPATCEMFCRRLPRNRRFLVAAGLQQGLEMLESLRFPDAEIEELKHVPGLSEALSFEMDTIGVKVKIVEPGMIKTDFGGRSLDFNNDESISEYQGVVGKLMATMEPLAESGSEPEVVAEVIYRAATDGTDQLRYTAGPDAAEILANRKAADDAAFMRGIKSQFGI